MPFWVPRLVLLGGHADFKCLPEPTGTVTDCVLSVRGAHVDGKRLSVGRFLDAANAHTYIARTQD